jgi:3-oxoacyl-[acyl-carrier protein] reductase
MQLCSIVTGGAQGIGRAIVDALLARGDAVAVFDCAPSDSAAALELVVLGCHYISVDVASAQSVAAGFTQLQARGLQPYILVNNAGITRDGLALRMSELDWDSVLDINLKGSFLCAQQALKSMIKQQKSYIINMSSIVGLHGNAGQAQYAASKAGLIGLTKSLAQEYGARQVLVNAIAPGFIETPMTDKLSDEIKQKMLQQIPLKRLGKPDDIAQLVAFLTSGMADYITGQVLVVSGGL